MATLTLDDLAPLRSGFRAKYLIDAAKKIAKYPFTKHLISVIMKVMFNFKFLFGVFLWILQK